ncbi:MAG: pilus assembly protein PilY [Rhodanobacter sp.]|nr:MAG: pilus assembly protein PilY [Rhodanobacter sp.]TAM13642.1 MAG: pilus assembly protein PilY [Rhodanobacter sp.]TAM35604.1 MAG: pilus assembly protein PilY [Rhodanobacter sp.]
MNTNPLTHALAGFSGHQMLASVLGVWLLGAIYVPSIAATVAIDQQPLTLQPPIPPNITLMLDDSGSMAWDYMPDACYLNGVTCIGTNNGTTPSNNGTDTATSTNNDAMIDASNNGLYYNPLVTYTPPVMANGTRYPNATSLTSAWIDGFNQAAGTVDLTNYSNQDIRGAAQSSAYPSLNLNYSTSVTSSTTTTYSETVANNWACSTLYSEYHGVGGFTFNNGVSTSNPANCTFQYYPVSHYFQFSTGPAAGPTYTKFYVATATQGCGSQPNCFPDSDTSGKVAPDGVVAGQNIANWFAYYHTRILMAKSGLMTAFSTVDKTFRVGFGSIDGDYSSDQWYPGLSPNNNNLPALRYSYTDTYNGGTNYVAEVQPFGDGVTGVTSSTPDQKTNFWNWLVPLTPKGGTPLRQALDAVGQYYQAAQPWSTMPGDPGYVAGGTNSPIACRQSYTILTTDGFWNGNYASSTTSTAADTSGPTVPGPNGQSGGYVATKPFSGGDTADGTPSLADVATYYWKNDLQSGIANEVPTNNADPAFWQHMVTFAMGLGFTPAGITGTTASGAAATIADIFNWAMGGTAIANFSWPAPASNSINNIADLAHAGVNGHGNFFSATSPQAFSSGLIEALKRAKERVGTGASLAANSTQLTNGTVAYQANYYTAKWKGDLRALPIDSSTGVISTIQSWSAATQLNAAATVSGTLRTYPNRKVVTYAPPASGTGAGTFVPFINGSGTPPTLSTTEMNALGSTTQAQTQMVDYLRGNNTLEQANGVGSYRNRETPLGDIVDSQPVYSGAPNPNEFENQSFTGISNTLTTGDNSFNAWAVGTVDASGNPVASPASQRETLVFVASNDGMLHAFDAKTGNEVYAYLPGAVITGGGAATGSATQLASLSNPSYGAGVAHQYYNDGELTIADVHVQLAKDTTPQWHTVLVGTTGRGPAEAVYALDVTDPANITPLWERSAADNRANNNGYIGQMVGKPVIAQVADGNWQVLIGNGYNSANGTAALLEFNIVDGTLSVHTAANRSGLSSAPNGLAAPVAWMGDPTTGFSDVAYAGDLQGQVWQFPLATIKTTGSTGSQVSTYTADLTSAGKLIFATPTDSSGNPQPITAGMLAGKNPLTNDVWLFFGTGQYLSATDLSNKQVESWYGLIAQNSGSTTPNSVTMSNLVQRQITYELDGNPAATPPTLGVRTVTLLPTPSDMTGKLGWYMNLVQPVTDASGAVTGSNALGERMVTPNQFQGNLLLGTTRIPVVTDVCNPSGSGWVMAVDPFTGTNPSAGFFLVNGGSGTVTLGGKPVPIAGVSFSSLPNNPIFVGGDMLMSFDNGNTSSLMTSGSTGAMRRVSWQELVNP